MSLELDFSPELCEREADYLSSVHVLRKLGFDGRLPSFDQVDTAISGLNPAAADFLREHCKQPTSIVLPNSSCAFNVSVIAELDLKFESISIGKLYSMLSTLLDPKGLRLLQKHEFIVFHKMKRSGIRVAPGGTYFPLYFDKNDCGGAIPVAILICDSLRFLTFPGGRMIPSSMACYVAAMVDITL